MAVEEHVKMLRRGVAVWNAWKQEHSGEAIDLSGAHLRNADLSRADLSGANLFGADLSGAHLFGAHLFGADLSHADLRNVDLSRAELSRAHLIGAHLIGAHLSDADLRDANLRNAHLSGADLIGAYLNGADLRDADLRDADLSGADLSGADLRNADLRNAELIGAHLSGVHLSGAHLSGAIVGQTIFGRLDLRMVEGLETIEHQGPSEISTSTLEKSNGEIPDLFLKGAGVSDTLIAYTHALFRQPIEYYTCFISYASQDELFARRLHNDLQQEGVRCWFAPEDLNIGDKIRHRIDESIRVYDKLLLILSAPAIASTWVAYEVKRALNKEPKGTHNVLYPVRIDQTILTCTEPWAHEIKSTRHIGNFEDWTNPQQYQENFKRLLRALNTKKKQQKK